MKHLWIVLGILWLALLAVALPAATVTRVACGSASDTGYTGGAPWTGAALAGQAAPYNAMRSSSPAGSPFSYTFALAPGNYTVTLQWIEPRADQATGARILVVAFNSLATLTALDLFTAAGALKPYSASYPVTITSGALRIDVSAAVGNAILSGIQIDDATTVPVVRPRPICEVIWGDGSAIGDGVHSTWSCENLDATPWTVTRVTCRSDVDGQVLDLLAYADGAWRTLLAAPMVCGPDRIDGVLVAGASYNGVILMALRISGGATQFVVDVILGSTQ